MSNDKKGWAWSKENPLIPDVMPNGCSWPRITIVTPSYNQGQFLEQAICSVLEQGYPNLEYIIMDGGSTDGSVEIIKKYEPWLAYWVSEPDGGQSQAINKGFACATGEIFGWLCSDDVLARGSLRTVAENLIGKSGVLLVGESIQTFDPDLLDGKPDKRRPTWQAMAYEGRTFPQPSTFWTSDLWKATGGLDETLYFAMDYDLWLRMRLVTNNEIFLDHVLSYARTHDGQKGRIALQTGYSNVFTIQRAYAAVRAANNRGELLFLWLTRAWVRRFRQGLSEKNWSRLRGSAFLWQSTQIAVSWMLGKRVPLLQLINGVEK